MKLPVSILTTIIAGILSCLITAIYISQAEKESGIFLYAFIMILGNIILPLFLTVCSYAFLKKRIKVSNGLARYLSQVGIILLISASGLCFMTVSKVVSYYSGLSGMTFQNLKENFNSSYRGFLPIVILYSFLIPLVYFFTEEKLVKLVRQK